MQDMAPSETMKVISKDDADEANMNLVIFKKIMIPLYVQELLKMFLS